MEKLGLVVIALGILAFSLISGRLKDTIITPPMVFAEYTAKVVEECRAKGIDKPIVASLVGDTEVEQACEYLYDRGIVAYPYTTETPVEVLGAKYRWARNAGLLG